MVIMKGTITKTTYIRSAGKTNSQPIRVSRRKILCKKFRRESSGEKARLSDVPVGVIVDLKGAGIFTRP
jgi:hypothetical protein